MRRAYRLDRWVSQPERVELWLEKDTIRGTVAAIAEEYQIPLLIARGFLSATAKNEACQRIAADPRPLTALYIGDHDPSGINMLEGAVEWVRNRLSPGAVFFVERIAITDDDRAAGSLLSFLPVNMKDSRAAAYVKRFGPTVVEVEALAPEELQVRVERAIKGHINCGLWEVAEDREEQDQAELEYRLGGSGQ